MTAASLAPAALPPPPFLPMTEPLWAVSFYSSAMLSVVVWDLILTLPAEIRRHRTRGFTRATVPFVLCRLLGLLTLILFVTAIRRHWSATTCSRVGRLIPYLANFSTLCSSAIFAMRTVAIWQGDRRIVVSVSLLWAAHIATSLYATSTSVVAAPGPGGLSCVPLMNPEHPIYWAYYIVNIIVDTAYLILSTWRLVIHVRRDITAKLSRHLLADGLLNFVAVDAVHILNACFFAAPTDWPFTFINASAAVAVTVIATSRLVLFTSATTNSSGAGGAGGANPAYPLVKQMLKRSRRLFASTTMRSVDDKENVFGLRDAENGSARKLTTTTAAFTASLHASSKGAEVSPAPPSMASFPMGIGSSCLSDWSDSSGSKHGAGGVPFEVFSISARNPLAAPQHQQQQATSLPQSARYNAQRSLAAASGVPMWTETITRREEEDPAAPRFFTPR